MYRHNEENIGSFIEKEFKHDSGRTLRARPEFTYRVTKDEQAIAKGYEHEIDVSVNAGEVRFANVMKTVAYVLCDGLYGNMVEQKWLLAKNTVFKNN